MDALWVILSSSLIFLMQVGFLCLEAGSTRRKNNINVAIKNIADLGLSTVIFWGVGYGLMFGASAQGWIGLNQFFQELGQAEGWPVIFFLFQVMFCSTAVTIVSGAVAERMNFKGYLLTAALISGLLYPIFGHWAWNGLDHFTLTGWLGQRGFVDFAGSTVVHSLGGWTALAAVLVIGPRTGRFADKKLPETSVIETLADPLPASDMPLGFLGVLLLWLGWFGFNGGSTFAFDARVPGILVNTLFAGAAGLSTPLLWCFLRRRPVSPYFVMNGVLAGLVSITANCHVVSSRSAIMIGAVGGLMMMVTHMILERWQIDDAVGAIPVHLGAGIWGTIAVALFGNLDRLGTGLSRMAQLNVQLSGVLACGLWTFTVALVCLQGLNQWMPLRVTHEQEDMGLNVSEHGAHSEFQDLFAVMKTHAETGDLQHRVAANSLTEIGQISSWYNQVIHTLEGAIARVNAIVTTAVDGIITIDPETLVVRTTNPAIEKIFGYSWLGIIGQPLTDLIGTDFKSRPDVAVTELYRLLEEGCRTGEALEAIGFHQKGQRFPIEVTATTSNVGTEIFWTVMVRNITARKATETALQESELNARRKAQQLKTAIAQLHQAQAQLLQSEKMASLGQMVAGITHEINNPLSFIHGNLEYAQNHVDDLLRVLKHYETCGSPLPPNIQNEVDALDIDFLREDFPRLVASMQNGTMRIRDIVKSLRNFSRHDESDLKVVDVHEGLDSTLLMLAHRFEATHNRAAITIQKRYGELPRLSCYAGALNQVFLSLFSNALDSIDAAAAADVVNRVTQGSNAMSRTANTCPVHAQGEITITTESCLDQITIAIADNGGGIAEDIQQKIFDPFFTTKSVGQGTGMGLAISHQIIVDKHGGQLHYHSSSGQGATFTITLPTTKVARSLVGATRPEIAS